MQTLTHTDSHTDLLRGVSVADRTNPIMTLHQLGGTGRVDNKALVIPFHLGTHINSIEYVSVQPHSSVGEHTQHTDEIYYLIEGGGELITNGRTSWVKAGDLVIAPRHTTHAIWNHQNKPLSFLVIEVQAPAAPTYQPQVVHAVSDLLQLESEAYPALLGQQHVSIRLARVALSTLFAGPWGMFTLLHIPPGCRLEPYNVAAYDENLFVVSGHGSIALDGIDGHPESFATGEDATHGLNVLVPANLQRSIVNRSSVDELMLLSVQISHS